MRDLLLFPFNGNAREAVSVVEAINAQCPTWNLLGFVDDAPEKTGLSFAGYSVLGGIQILFLGIMGEYLWRNLDEARRRPLYFIETPNQS